MDESSYAKAGVDVRKVSAIHRSMAKALASTHGLRDGRFGRPLIPIGHYAGLIDIGNGNALALHADGVGTKVVVAQLMEKFDTVGIDCVAMTVNDLACLGCEPVAMLDYITLQREDDELVSEVVEGLVEGAKQASVAIVGGETAVMGEVVRGVKGRGFDLAGMGVGLVSRRSVIDGSRIEAGDSVVGVASSGLHSNGFTLARKVLLRRHRVTDEIPGLDKTLGDELLEPTVIYTKGVERVLAKCDVHGIGHITGGGLTKLARLVGNRNLGFRLGDPRPQKIFRVIQKEGGISEREMLRTFNMGVGLCVVLGNEQADDAIGTFSRLGCSAFEFGRAVKGSGITVDGTRLT